MKWWRYGSAAYQVAVRASIRAVALMSLTVGVSFARTPVAEVSAKAAELESLGWREVGRGDPWAVSYNKDVPEEDADPYADVRAVMGDYWMTADEMRDLRASTKS
jgi:hypothetical protein